MHSDAPDRAFCASAAATFRRWKHAHSSPLSWCSVCDGPTPAGSIADVRSGLILCPVCAYTCANCGCKTLATVVTTGGFCEDCHAALDDVLAETGAGPEVLAS